MSRGAWMPMRTFSPMIDSTETSMSSPIMIDWLDLRVSTSMPPPPWRVSDSFGPMPAYRPTLSTGEVSPSSTLTPWGLHPSRLHAGLR